ncbi:lamin tail domain-containing protein [Thermoproteota archaeon]
MIEKLVLLGACLFLLVVFNAQTTKALHINELMYNPSSEMGDDSDLEWIELHNLQNESVILFNYTVSINNKLFTLPNITLDSGSYLVLARELKDGTDKDNNSFFDYYGDNFTAAELKFSLPNTGGSLSLWSGQEKVHELNYSDNIGGDGDGFSLEVWNNTLRPSQEYGGTPGRQNSISTSTTDNATNTTQNDPVTTGIALSVYADDIVYTGLEYTKLFRIQNLDHVSGVKDCVNATVKYDLYLNGSAFRVDFIPIICLNSVKTADTGIFITKIPGIYELCGQIINATSNFSNRSVCKNITVIDTGNIDCNISITDITFDKFIYDENEKIGYKIDLDEKRFPFIIKYSITDLFGKEFRTERNTTNTNKRSFTPSGLKESDKVYSINAEVIPFCNDLNISDNKISEFLVVKRNSEEDPRSVLSIKKIMTKEPKFGSAVLTNVVIYKGDTTKRVVKVFATTKEGKKISSEAKVYLNDKFTSYEFTLPVQLNDDCDKKYPTGTYYIVAEGIDLKERQRFSITGWTEKECPQPKENKTCIMKENKTAKKQVNADADFLRNAKPVLEQDEEKMQNRTKNSTGSDKMTGMTVYRSASSRSMTLLPFLFFISSLMVSLLIIFKKL